MKHFFFYALVCATCFSVHAYPPGTLIKVSEPTMAYSVDDTSKPVGKIGAGGMLKVTAELPDDFLQANYRSSKQKKFIDVAIKKEHLASATIKTPNGKTILPAINKKNQGPHIPSKGSSFTQHRTNSATLRSMAKTNTVPLDMINEAFGSELLINKNLWGEPVQDIAERLGWPIESNTSRSSSYRLYANEKVRILGARPYSLVLYGEQGMPLYISMIFANKGDLGGHALETQMGADKQTIHEALSKAMGEPRKETFGQGKGMTETVYRWDWKHHAFLLAAPDGEYVSIRIIPSGAADAEGKGTKFRDATLRKMLLGRLIKRSNGDVVVGEIPMVDQGPKGYCMPATFERYLRYMEVPADMYMLAMLGGTKQGGGTSPTAMIDASQSLVMRYGRKLVELKEDASIDNLKKYIDQGIPVMWIMRSGERYNLTVNKYTAERKASGDQWGNTYKAAAAEAIKNINDNGPHICMIIGYNKKTNEFAVSDSWGPQFAERWLPVDAVGIASHKNKPGYIKMSPFHVIRF